MREHAGSGARDEAELGGDDGSLFGIAHLPAGDAVGAVVACPPVFEEFQSNFRREVLLGRALVDRGIAVYRFHYRGTGNSDAGAGGMTMGSMASDAEVAAERLLGRVGSVPLGFIGTRLGAIVASQACRSTRGSALAAWEPALEAERHLREILRAQKVKDLVATTERAPSPDPFAGDGWVDVAGYPLPRSLWESARGWSFAELAAGVDHVLMLQLGRKGEPRASLSAIGEQLRRDGAKVDVEAVVAEETWWFSNDPTKTRGISGEIAGMTADWFKAVLA